MDMDDQEFRVAYWLGFVIAMLLLLIASIWMFGAWWR